ncbi:TPA: hypothetical protein N0F65_007347 [Lagenidium giganteum]|uniref:Uncharacterized protein n=1 Tax=Lagenidium giganteum TaxID=4803 RepID=A0AAV2YGF2_9STRA|nr:TPA: hypothetical protein N0F65_007347 [Lagenidium giganteum]
MLLKDFNIPSINEEKLYRAYKIATEKKGQCLLLDSVKGELRSDNIVSNGVNNILRYEFPGSSINFLNIEIAIHSILMYNSQFNIDSTAYGNNMFSIIVPTAATTSTIDITLPDRYYSYADINQMIQTALVSAGAYLIDSNGNNVYYVQITENATYYAAQVDLAKVPTALPSGYARPSSGLFSSGGSGLPLTAYTPQLVINNAELGKIIGFSSGTYLNAQTTTAQSLLSNITPQAKPVSAYMLRSSLSITIFSPVGRIDNIYNPGYPHLRSHCLQTQ